MAVVQSTYPTRIGRGTPGMLRSQAAWDAITRILETAAGAGFGLAVSQGTEDKGCILGGSLAGFLGITQKDVTIPVTRTRTTDQFAQYDSVGVLTKGEIYVTAGSDVNVANNPGVYFDPVTGAFSADAGVRSASRAADGTNTGNGAMTLANPAVSAEAAPGKWRVVVIGVAANGGELAVFDPEGVEVDRVAVGTAYDGDIKFTVADGATDFAAGDAWSVIVGAAAVGPIPGARWLDSGQQGDVLGLRLAGH